MTDKEEPTIAIRENPLYNYENVIEKIISGKITKLLRRKQFQNGKYRLKKQFSDKHFKLTPEYINILNSTKVMWIKLTSEEAKVILGTDNPPIIHNYLTDLRGYLGKHDLAMYNTPYLYLHTIEYIKRPVQRKLEV
jgi:hypothetical protein